MRSKEVYFGVQKQCNGGGGEGELKIYDKGGLSEWRATRLSEPSWLSDVGCVRLLHPTRGQKLNRTSNS